MGNRRPLQNIWGALAGEKKIDGSSLAATAAPGPGLDPSGEASPQPHSEQRCRARRGLGKDDAPVAGPLRAALVGPRLRGRPRQGRLAFVREVWLFFVGGLFEEKGGEALGARPAWRPRRPVRARRAATHPPLLELGGHGGLCIPSLSGPLIKPSLLGGDPGGPPRAR